jgi:hypothetical protein
MGMTKAASILFPKQARLYEKSVAHSLLRWQTRVNAVDQERHRE